MKTLKEKLFQYITYLAALFTILCMLAIIFGIFREGLPLFRVVSLKQFIFTNNWYPTHAEPAFGALALIVGSLAVTLGALLIAVPLGLGSAIFISEIAGSKMREAIKPIIELLAGIPSVVYGLFGMAFLAPLVRQWFNLDTGLNVFSASIILGVMIVPIISSLSEDALSSVPSNIREASMALGATRSETIFSPEIDHFSTWIIYSSLVALAAEPALWRQLHGGDECLIFRREDFVRPERSAALAALEQAGDARLGRLAGLLRETDILISVPHERAARVREVHALVPNCLCDGIDSQLFGEQENP